MAFFDKVMQKAKDVVSSAPQRKKVDIDKMDETDITLPPSLLKYDNEYLRDTIQNEFDRYRAIGYKDKPLEKLRVKEYNSLEMGLILRYIKDGSILKIDKVDDIIPSFIINSPKKKLHNKAFEVVNRFNNGVSKDSNLMDLEREIRWTAEDIGYVLMYITLAEEE